MVKEIFINNTGISIFVDDDDYERVNLFNWKLNGAGYPCKMRKRRPRALLMHRFVLGIIDPKIILDHIDGNKCNNQKSNLRIVTGRQNSQNKHTKKTSKYPGVSLYKRTGKWQVSIMIDKKKKHIGLFDNEDAAFAAYKDYLLQHCNEKVL